MLMISFNAKRCSSTFALVIVCFAATGSVLAAHPFAAKLSADKTVAAPPYRPVWGFADVHNHQFSNHALGGKVTVGQAFPYSYLSGGTIAEALPCCSHSHSESACSSSVDYHQSTGGILEGEACGDIMWMAGSSDVADLCHNPAGYPEFKNWPSWYDTSHQEMYVDWLQRAWEGGLRLWVPMALEDTVFCDVASSYVGTEECNATYRADNPECCFKCVGLTPLGYGPGGCLDGEYYVNCDEACGLKRQIQYAKDLEKYVEWRSGGHDGGWFKIVYSASEARDAINSGRLAVVLGMESSDPLECSLGDCSHDEIAGRLQSYYNLGVRHMHPVHHFDNAFGGASVFDPFVNIGNREVTGACFSTMDCGSEGFGWRLSTNFTKNDQANQFVEFALRILDCANDGDCDTEFIGDICDNTLVQILVFPIFGFCELTKIALEKAIDKVVEKLGDFLNYEIFAAFYFFVGLNDEFEQDFCFGGYKGDSAHCNTRGLTSDGEYLLQKMQDLQMIVDVDHMSYAMRNGFSGQCSGSERSCNGTCESGDYICCLSRFDHCCRLDSAVDEGECVFRTGANIGVWDVLENACYPAIASHCGFVDLMRGKESHEQSRYTNREVNRMHDIGGLISPIIRQEAEVCDENNGWTDCITEWEPGGIANSCDFSSRTFAQAYLYAVDHMEGVPVPWGSDFGGPLKNPSPRYGTMGSACWPSGTAESDTSKKVNYVDGFRRHACAAGTLCTGADVLFHEQTDGDSKPFEINVDGLAHVGMYPDFIQDLKMIGMSDTQLEPLFLSAEAYVSMWERIEGDRQVVYTHPESTGCGAGTPQYPYPQLVTARGNVRDGGFVVMAAGTYSEVGEFEFNSEYDLQHGFAKTITIEAVDGDAIIGVNIAP